MEQHAARTLATELFERHGLHARGWKFGFDNAERRLGVCIHSRSTITISAKMTAAATQSEVEQTLLHEIAHALTPGTGHGPRWQAKARSIGYNGERTAPNPHVTQHELAFLPQEYRGLEPDRNLAVGTQVVVIRGGAKFTGKTGHVVKRNPKTYQLQMADGLITAAHAAVAAIPGAARVGVVQARRPSLCAGERVVVRTPGHHLNGQEATVHKVNRTRCIVEVASRGQWSLPFSAVEKVPEPRTS